MKSLVSLTIFILGAIFLFSCSGEDGKQGDPGTVNVIYSEWLTPDWVNSFSVYFRNWYVTDENIPLNYLIQV